MPTHTDPVVEPLPPHMDYSHAVAHSDYVATMLAELMDDAPAPPRPTPTQMDRIVGRAFADGIEVGRMLAVRDYESAMRDAIAAMGLPR